MASGITINSNLAALNAQRRLGQSTQSVQQSFARLSSGLRINKASDDAAGLAIASGLNVDRRVFDQGVRNLNDGISAMNIADASVESLGSIVMRLEELAEQSANGTLGHKQRASLDDEAQALSREYFRIARSAEFNGRQLLDGSIGDVRLQGGYGQSGGLTGSFGGEIGTGGFAAASAYTSGGSPALGDLNGDGALDIVGTWGPSQASVSLGNGDGSFRARTGFTTGNNPFSVTLGDLNGDGILDIVTADDGSDQASVLLGNGDGSFRARTGFTTGAAPQSVALGDLNGDGVLDMVTADYSSTTQASVMLGNGDGSFRARTGITVEKNPTCVALGDLDGDGALDLVATDLYGGGVSVLLGNGNGSFKTVDNVYISNTQFVTLGDLNGDDALDMVVTDNSTSSVKVVLGNGNGSFRSAKNFATGSNPTFSALGDLNGDGALDIVTANPGSSQTSVLLGNGDGSFRARTAFTPGGSPASVALGDANGDGVLDMVTPGSVLLAATKDGTAPLLPFDLSTMAGARQALPVFKSKLDQLSAQRAEIGAFQSRISVALNTLQVASENYAAAASQITDADVAQESAQLLKNQILQQAGAAVLAQANQAPALALMLLRSG
jgi:flagellin-like hook-associated protein FlgL